MLFLNGHGRGVLGGTATQKDINEGYVTLSSACGFTGYETYPDWDDVGLGQFDYFFPDAAPAPSDPGTTEALRDIASAMIDQDAPDTANSSVPALFTYVGQFVDHDITAGTDRERSVSEIDKPIVEPLPRDTVVSHMANIRTARLDLDCLYGGAPVQGRFAEEFTFGKLLRHPSQSAKLWIGQDTLVRPNGQVQNQTPPNDPAGDLLRLQRVLDSGRLTEAQIRALPADLRKMFMIKGTDEINPRKAIIGDMRNDENLAVAQVHLAMARLHNKTVDYAHTIGGPTGNQSDAAFEFARRQTRWQYQWLVINDYLPGICDPDVLKDVLSSEAQVYRAFLKRSKSGATDRLPMPLEFSVAAFRFGHTMARPSYDWNQFFGREALVKPDATFRDLFQFTGGGDMRGAPTLPSNWSADWSRLTDTSGTHPMRTARAFDTHIAPDLLDMPNEDAGLHARMKHLAERNLRRGHRLNVPSGQACLHSLKEQGIDLPELSEEELKTGPGGDILAHSGLIKTVPLWYYVLREAELMAKGQHLGPLGSRLVAETLVGLIRCDPDSYWFVAGDGPDGEWHPSQNVQPADEVMDSFAKAFRAAGVL